VNVVAVCVLGKYCVLQRIVCEATGRLAKNFCGHHYATTEFGYADCFAGTMKGVILGIRPRTQIVDITRNFAASDIWAGTFALAAIGEFFSEKSCPCRRG
jgi:SAM hydroxide adenosyltransferase N-terminal domain